MFKHIAILGTGTIGASWASFFLSKGFHVKIFDQSPQAVQNGEQLIFNQLINLKSLKELDDLQFENAKKNLQTTSSLKDLLHEVDYVQESVIEDYNIKDKVYREMEQHVDKNTIIASSSSGLLISKMQQSLAFPERSLIVHPFNPPHLIPLVELVPGPSTNQAIVDKVKTFFTELKKTPVILKKEVPGHIANRLAAAVWREALSLVDQGVASLEDVDKALSSGPGIRWAIMGQHLIYELGGGDGGYEKFLDIFGNAFSEYWKDMETWETIPESAKKKAIEGVKSYFEDKPKEEWVKTRDINIVRILKSLTL